MAAVPAVGRECRERRHRRRAPLSHLRLISIVAVAAAAAVASTGCGQEKVMPDIGATFLSCNLEALAECDEIIGGMTIMQQTGAQDFCRQRGGSSSLTTRCPTTPVVGTCSIAGMYGAANLIARYYPPADLATAQSWCKQMWGVWAFNNAGISPVRSQG
jgi:hypothetical protein